MHKIKMKPEIFPMCDFWALTLYLIFNIIVLCEVVDIEPALKAHLRRHSKIIPFPVDRPGEINLQTYPAAFFFFFFFEKNYDILVNSCPIFKRFSPLHSK